MKTRINISIEYETYLLAKEYIKNLSKFVEKGINNYCENIKQMEEKKAKELSPEEQEKMREMIRIASVRWDEVDDND